MGDVAWYSALPLSKTNNNSWEFDKYEGWPLIRTFHSKVLQLNWRNSASIQDEWMKFEKIVMKRLWHEDFEEIVSYHVLIEEIKEIGIYYVTLQYARKNKINKYARNSYKSHKKLLLNTILLGTSFFIQYSYVRVIVAFFVQLL